MHLALTRPVPPSIATCELTHLARTPIDAARAAAQHEVYEDALRKLGCTVRRLAGQPDHPDSVFIEDTAVVLDECAIVARPGAESRRGEVPAVADVLGLYRRLFTIQAPGTLDGGDVLVAGRRVFVGRSTRTNDAGIRQLATFLVPSGYTVDPVAVTRCLHLKTAATSLGDGRILHSRALIDASAFAGVACVATDHAEPQGANVVSVGRAVLCASSAPRTARLLEREGFAVHPVDASELAKAEGGLTCCSLVLTLRDDAVAD